LSEFETFEAEQPEMPDFTCPHIDNVNDWLHKASEEMELLRNMNSKLRDNAEFWKESCEQIQNKLDNFRQWKADLQNIVNNDI
jgi:t-SNARE complex subunit (syntaxin)